VKLPSSRSWIFPPVCVSTKVALRSWAYSAAELRNSVYDYAANKEHTIDRYLYHCYPNGIYHRTVPVPTLALVQVSHAIREEYVNYFIASRPVQIDLQDLDSFLGTFFPVANVAKTVVEKYRVCINISVSTLANDTVEADIIPLLKVLMMSPNINASFMTSRIQDYMQASTDSSIEARAASDLNLMIARPDPQP
jgi:hypothetical protein